LGLQILIRSLLVFLIHRARRPLRKESNSREHNEADTDTDRCVCCDAPSLSGWILGAWAVGAEGDIVCSFLLLRRQLHPISLHTIPQRHPQIRLLLRRHRLPPLLDIRQRWVRDCVCPSSLRDRDVDRGRSYECCLRASEEGLTKHCVDLKGCRLL